MSALSELMPSMIDRIRHDLVGLKMPRALEALDQIVRRLEHAEISALEAVDILTTGPPALSVSQGCASGDFRALIQFMSIICKKLRTRDRPGLSYPPIESPVVAAAAAAGTEL